MNNFQLTHERILCALNKNQSKSMSARQLMAVVSTSVIYQARRIEQLVELGFINKSKLNGRKHVYQLTEKGKRLASLLEEFDNQ